MADSSQQTEKPTVKRLEKARKEGNFPHAREFVSAVQFLAFVVLGAAWFPEWMQGVENALRSGLRQAFSDPLTAGELMVIFQRLSIAMLRPLAILGLFLMVITIFFQAVSTNLGFSLSHLAPKFERLNGIRKLKDLPGNNFGTFMQAVALIPVMFWLTWTIVRDHMAELLRLPIMSIAGAAATTGHLLSDALRRASYVLVMLGLLLLVRERARYSKRLRMSKQEIRDEARESDGSPQTKARVKRLQRDMRRKNMMKNVATATAIIVNPTHYAVAIKYEQGSMAAPTVVAKGKNFLAARIRKRALENLIPIIENPPLAQTLYKSVDVGQEIPAHLYRAVAEILAYIFKLMARK